MKQKSDLQKELEIMSCDDEPIHLLGKIQSVGILMAFDKKSYFLTHYDEKTEKIFEEKGIKGQIHLSSVLGGELFKYIQKLNFEKFTSEFYPNPVTFFEEDYRCYIGNSTQEVIIELEKKEIEEIEDSYFNQYNKDLQNIISSEDLESLYSTSIYTINNRLKFDRVMMYQFDDEGHGEVIAEEKKIGLNSFLGLKFPSTDIPKQARRLYLQNPSRSIHETSDKGYQIVSRENNNRPLDLSNSVFRSVSEIHIKYLQNMGITASHSISIIVQKKLWGLIICHNYSGEKYLNFNDKKIGETLALIISNKIEALNGKLKVLRQETLNQNVSKIIFSDKDLEIEKIIENSWSNLKNILNIDGLSIIKNGIQTKKTGDTPQIEELPSILNWIKKENINKVTSTNNIRTEIKNWKNEEILGIIILPLNANDYLFLFRKGKSSIINWAGNPEKSLDIIEVNNRKFLTPRASFELWQQKTGHEAEKWTDEELKFASDLLTAISSREYSKSLENKNSKFELQTLITNQTEELYRLSLKLQAELQENKKYQMELEAAKTASENLNKLKSEFISNISHEIRTPITGIIGLARLINSKLENKEKVSEINGLILDSANRLLSTINRVLNVSKLENKKIELVFETINVREALLQSQKELNILAAEKNIRIIFNTKPNEIYAITDKHYFNQIYTNIVGNAIKYTENHGWIEINTKQLNIDGSPMIQISVEDNGIGIDEKSLKKIFDPFHSDLEPSKQRDNSTGLGLYLVKNYLNYLKGEIFIESSLGKGTKFTYLIPKNN